MKATSGCIYVLTAFWGILFTTQTSQSNTENVALNKQYTMSRPYNNRKHAGNAANNNTNGEFTPTNCIHTGFGDYNPWWEVDLGRRYVISNITVWSRTGYANRMANTSIWVDDDKLCFSFNTSYNNSRDTQFPIVCTKHLVGQIVGVVKNGTGKETNGDETLNICEVQVFSCKDPFWGNECNQCGHCLGGEVCDKVDGHCTNCSAGFMLPTCVRECPAGTYGHACSLKCSERCLDSDCDKVSGLCACKPGWNGSMCDQACSDGSYGLNCTSNCSAGCSNICSKEDGYCNCTSEWAGKKCDIRKDQLQVNQRQMAVIGGAVGGSVGLIIIAAVIIVCIVRRRRSGGRKSTEQNNAGTKPTTNANVYQNSRELDLMQPYSQEKPSAAVKPIVSTKPAVKNDSNMSTDNAEHHYSNVAFVNDDSKQPTSSSTAVDQPDMVNKHFNQTHAADVTISGNEARKSKPGTSPKPKVPPKASPFSKPSDDEDEKNEDVDEMEDSEQEVEPEMNYDVSSAREKVYYNDGIYMTFEASELKLDDIQQGILDKLRGDIISQEFQSLPDGLQKPHTTGALGENYNRNRFNAILPYEESRVVLQGKPDPGSNDYINASYIRGANAAKEYIASQGPRPNTVGDFWKMVCQDKVTHIVMLTNLKDGKKKKCHMYWPSANKAQAFGSVEVTLLETQVRANYIVRRCRVKPKKGERYNVMIFHYTTWPDHGIPTTTALVDFWRTVRSSSDSQKSPAPLLVHCSAGVGRTGTFIALDILMNQVQQQQKKQQQPHVNVLKVVQGLREDRCNMVQAKSQYYILHEAFLEAYTCRDCRLDLLTFGAIFKHPINPSYSNPRIDTEFKKLKQMKLLLQKPDHTEAEQSENLNKNRFLDVLPDDNHLVRLMYPLKGRTDYINAVWLPTLTEQNGSILTQLPLVDTIVDFWRLVAGYDVIRIVSLECDVEDGEKKSTCFWPLNVKQSVTYGPFTLRLNFVGLPEPNIKQYRLSLKSEISDWREVELIHYNDWKTQTPGNTRELLQLIDSVIKQPSARAPVKEGASGPPPVVLQCKDGASKCGLFAVLCEVISRMRSDREVDAYTAVRNIHSVRPECLTSEVHYRFIFHVAQEYRKLHETYGNV